MKKIKNKLSYLTKVFLVFGLLFSNLSSLKVVFAYEGEEETVISEKQEEVIEEENTDSEVSEKENNDELVEENTDSELLEEDNKNEEEVLEEEKETSVEENLEEENTTEEKEEETNEDNTTDDEETLGEEATQSEETNEGEEPVSEEETVEHDYTKELNESAKTVELDYFYLFTEGKVYVVEEIYDNEIDDIVNNAFENVTYEINDNKLVLTDGDKTITYETVIYNEEYVNELMKKAVGNGDTTSDDDINGDGTVDAYDVASLKQILRYGFGNDVVKQQITIDSKFDGDTSNLKVGDTFTVQYVLTLSEYSVDGITGHIKYNKDMLNLDKVEVRNFDSGEEYDGKFLYFGDELRGTEKVIIDEEGNELTTYEPTDYVVVVMTFTAKAGGNDTISIDDIGYFYDGLYYEGNTSGNIEVNVISSNNRLSSVNVAGQEITIDELTDVYSITVGNDVTNVDLSYVLADQSSSITSIVAPEELAVGENVITITVVSLDGEERTYTINVTREEEPAKEETTEEVVAPVNYQDAYNDYDDNKEEDKEVVEKEDKKEDKKKEETKDESKLSKVIIIILILLAIAGLIYLIFKDEDDEETKKANKEVNKLKKEELKEVNSKKEVNNKKTKKKER